jgi:uncharacterized Zn finger protein
MTPVAIAGRKIALTFWGKAWCDNLERYRDFAYRLERGRSYVRNGSVIDLKLEAGKIIAKVSGSSLYDVAIEIDSVARDAWRAIQRDCAGSIGSRVDLLSGRLSEPVMVRLCAERTGLFPVPSAIRFTCSCPDYAIMCKHVAAVMYGVGARLDGAPELLFTLRQVSLDELVASALEELPAAAPSGRALGNDGLAALFGIELATTPSGSMGSVDPPRPSASPAATEPARKPARATSKPARATTKPARATSKPARATTKPARGATKRGATKRAATKPARAAIKPARAAAKPARPITATAKPERSSQAARRERTVGATSTRRRTR